jgi:hypothetical protein
MPASRIPRTTARNKPKPDLRRRARHLAFIRQLPCVACGKAAPSEAAHVRSGSDAGAGIKPSDRYSVSLCTSCHELQHRFGELRFWSVLRIDPVNVALRLWTVSGDLEAGERIVFRARQHINLMKVAGPERRSVLP